MNSDQDIVKAAYENTIADLYANLFEGYTEAAGHSERQQEADQRFLAGVGPARNARDRALTLITTDGARRICFSGGRRRHTTGHGSPVPIRSSTLLSESGSVVNVNSGGLRMPTCRPSLVNDASDKRHILR